MTLMSPESRSQCAVNKRLLIGARHGFAGTNKDTQEMSNKEQILDHIKTVILAGSAGKDISTSDDLIDSGLMDSLALMRLIQYLEETYDVTFDGMDVVPDNFQSVDAMADLLEKKKAA